MRSEGFLNNPRLIMGLIYYSKYCFFKIPKSMVLPAWLCSRVWLIYFYWIRIIKSLGYVQQNYTAFNEPWRRSSSAYNIRSSTGQTCALKVCFNMNNIAGLPFEDNVHTSKINWSDIAVEEFCLFISEKLIKVIKDTERTIILTARLGCETTGSHRRCSQRWRRDC